MTAKFWVGGTGTWDNSTTTHWSLSTGGAGGAAVPGSGDTITFDGASGGGTVTVDTTINGLTFTSIVMGAFTGTLDFSVNNPSITLASSFSGTGSGIRTLNLGSGTFTLSGANGAVWDFGTSTNLTLSAGTSTIAASASANNNRSMNLGAKNLNNVTIADSSGGSTQFTVVPGGAGATIANLTVGAKVNLSLSFTQTLTISNSANISGTSASSVAMLGNGTYVFPASTTINFAVVQNMTASGTPTATNSFNLGGNSGITINGPSGGAVGVIGS